MTDPRPVTLGTPLSAQARRVLRLTLLAPAVVEPLLANSDVAVNLESVLCRVMPLDWQVQGVREQGAVFAGQ